jgi:hypothetical protein
MTVVVLFGASSVLEGGTEAALSGTTENAANTFSAGTVSLTDNDAGSALLTLANARPGAPVTNCLQVTYTGSLTAGVRLYAAFAGPLAPHVRITVTRGAIATPTFGSCTGFTADAANHRGLGAGVLFSGPLSTYPTTFATGLVDPTAAWATNGKVSYRFTAEIIDTNAAQGLSCTATFTWEARS